MADPGHREPGITPVLTERGLDWFKVVLPLSEAWDVKTVGMKAEEEKNRGLQDEAY